MAAAAMETKTVKKRPVIFTGIRNVRNLKDFLETQCRQVSGDDGSGVFIPRVSTTYTDEIGWLKKVEVGARDIRNVGVEEKVILLMGATGVGKSTTINAMANYMMGVKFEDPFRIKLVDEVFRTQADSVTRGITAYTLHYQPWFQQKYNLTLVDPPGFGDTRGIETDQKIVQQIEKFFKTRGQMGISHLDVVAFIMIAAMPRLTVSQKYIFDSILTIFGKNIAENIFLLFTHADGGKPLALTGVHEARIPYTNYFKFNFVDILNMDRTRSTNESDSDEGEDDLKRLFWKMAIKSFENFFNALTDIQPKSLTSSVEVMDRRRHLQEALNNLHEKANMSVQELESLNDDLEVIEEYNYEPNENRDRVVETLEHYVVKQELSKEYVAINCVTCDVTCLKTKYRWSDVTLKECWLFQDTYGETRGCGRCPRRCQHDQHRCQQFTFTVRTRKVERRVEDLVRSYQDGGGRAMTVEDVMEECRKRIEKEKRDVMDAIEQAVGCTERLNEIALKPKNMSIDDYIDLMIVVEEREFEPGLAKRRQTLLELKEKEAIRHGLQDAIKKQNTT